MINFKTISGSSYELDTKRKLIRKVSGQTSTTVRQGDFGEWKPYKEITQLIVGESTIIIWPDTVDLLPGSPSFATPATMTSPIKEFSEEYQGVDNVEV